MNRRIAPRNEAGIPLETPKEVFLRTARTIASASTNPTLATLEFYDLMASRRFIPNSPCLVNAGRELGMMSACFVLPVPDSIEGIYDGVKYTALIHKSGGGTGFSFSKIRANGSFVGTTSGIASGPVSFMKVYDAGTEAIKQGGTRRGANMGILRVDHPDIAEFISLKSELGPDGKTSLENFNISVGVTEEFMVALASKPSAPWKESGLTAQEIWDNIAQAAWRTGDPGVIFLDTINKSRSNPVPSFGPIEATNPCGEQPLYDFDSCNLGSINLAEHLRSDATIDWEKLTETTRQAVEFLDNVITLNKYPLPQIEEMTHRIRRIGLGVMGWADVLIAKGMMYDSQEAMTLGADVMSYIAREADLASQELAQRWGAFPEYQRSIYASNQPLEVNPPFRNATRTTIAPTGTISIIAGCSSGIEPLFAPVFRRRHKIDRDDPDAWFEMFEIHAAFKDALAEVEGVELSRVVADLADEKVTITQLVEDGTLPPEFLIFRGANEIPFEAHVAMQAAFQRYTDNGVSKTINLPESATVEDIKEAYLMAYARGCTGITIYRHNCRSVQVLGGASTVAPVHTPPSGPVEAVSAAQPAHAPRRRKLLAERDAVTHKMRIGDTEGYLTVGLFPDGTPGEVFLNVSKQGSTVNGLFDTVAMLVSYCLQYNVPMDVLFPKLAGISFEPSGMTSNRSIPTAQSIVDYVARWMLLKFTSELTPATFDIGEPVPSIDHARNFGKTCPTCGVILVHEGGCAHCQLCGYQDC